MRGERRGSSRIGTMNEPDENEARRAGESREEGGKPEANRGALGRVTAYVLALEAADHAWDDARIMRSEPLLATVAEQLMRSVTSVSANIADGYGRRSPRDRIRFWGYALSENGEAETWYWNGRHVLPAGVLDERLARLTSIRRLVLTMIKRERRGGGWNDSSPPRA